MSSYVSGREASCYVGHIDSASRRGDNIRPHIPNHGTHKVNLTFPVLAPDFANLPFGVLTRQNPMTKAEKALRELIIQHREEQIAKIKELSNAIESGRYIVVKHFYGYCSLIASFASRKDAQTMINLYQMYDDNCSLEIRDTE